TDRLMGGMVKRSAAMLWLKTVMPAPIFDGLGHATPQFRCNRALGPCQPARRATVRAGVTGPLPAA
ncbi:unnamed protein product, partial [marine sediment metagenome]